MLAPIVSIDNKYFEIEYIEKLADLNSCWYFELYPAMKKKVFKLSPLCNSVISKFSFNSF